MYKSILVPIDLADSNKAIPMIEAAKKMAEKDANIILVNVIEAIPGFIASQLPAGAREKVQQDALTELKKIAKTASLKGDIEMRTGSANLCILDVAKERNADLILIGSHKPGVQDYLLGSTASRVVRHAECSVFVLR